MTDLSFEWQIDEYMVYCRSKQLRERTMSSYEQTLRLFERWCRENMGIDTVDKVTESIVRRYINDLQDRGKYAFYVNDKAKNYVNGVQDCSRGGTYHNRRFRETAEARGLKVDFSERYGWAHTSPGEELLDFVLKYGLTDILLNRNDTMGYRITGTGTHSGITVGGIIKKSSTRKYCCPCCGISVRATKMVNIGCLDCGQQMIIEK